MAFALVVFAERNELAVIPITWLKGKHCVWPNCKNKDITKLVIAAATPEPDWSWHEIKILSIYDTFEDARKHERKAEDLDTSNVDTDPAEELGRGHRIRKRFLTKEERENGMGESSTSDEEERLHKHLCFPAVPEIMEGEQEEELLSSSYIIPEISDPPTVDYIVLAENATPTEQNESRNEKYPKSFPGPPESRLLKDILHMKMTLREHGEMLQSIMHALNTLVERGTIQETCNQVNRSLPVSLPLQTCEDLNSLEEHLVDEGLQEHLCTLIAQIGGLNVGNSIRRMMNRLMTNEVAMLFSWLGAKEKQPFVNLRLKKIIFDAVRRNKLYEGVQDSIIEIIIKDWLRHAKARSKNPEKP